MKYKVIVIEVIHETYDEVEIEANDDQEARAIAEEMRVNADLGDPDQAVVDVQFDITKVKE